MEKKDPPISGRDARTEKWRAIVNELRRNRGEWHEVGTFSPGVAAQIRGGKYGAFLDELDHLSPERQMATHWEVTTRGAGVEGSRRSRVFIRWLG